MIKDKKFRLLITNIAIYIILFSVFSIIIFQYVAKKQYENVDAELLRAKHSVSENHLKKENHPFKLNPRMVMLIRDSNGNIVDCSDINGFLENYRGKIEAGKLNEIIDLTIDKYKFRSVYFKDETSEKDEFIQLLMNVDVEQEMLYNLLKILIIGGSFIIILSIGISWYLTNKSMISIIQSLKRQREFVEDASHELRTPLTIIQSKLELLLKEPNAKIIDKLEYISPALSETRRISKMVGNLLTLARADSNVTELEKETVDMESLINETIEPYREMGELAGKQVCFICNGDQHLICDKGRIHQLIIILLDNALKYTNEGGNIRVITSRKENKFVISVEDDGIGVEKENRQRIFQRFFREDASRTRETGGSGLGLSIANWIVQQHGGNIKCLENSPRGTVMKVTLPSK